MEFFSGKKHQEESLRHPAANPGPEADGFKKQAERYGKDEQKLFLTVAVTLLHFAIAIAELDRLGVSERREGAGGRNVSKPSSPMNAAQPTSGK